MREDWEIKKLGELCEFVRGPFGGSLKKSCFVEEGYAVYEQQHAIYDQFNEIRYFIDDKKFDEMSRFELKPGDLIMSCSGTIGKVAIVPDGIKKGIINQALLKLTPNNNIDVQYLKYWFLSDDFLQKIAKHSKGVAIKNVASVKILKTIEFLLPPLIEQKRIVAILDKAFEAIDKANANVKRNIENAEEMFQSKLNEIFSQRGEGWEEFTVKELGDVQTGTTPSTKDESNYGDFIPFVKPAHFQPDGSLDYGDSMLSKKGLENGRLFKKKSVLMVCIGASIGKTGYTDIPVSSNQQINAVTPKDMFDAKLIYYGMISRYFFDQVLLNASQTTLPIINKTKWSNLKLNLPIDKEVQRNIISNLDDVRSETISIIDSNKRKLEAIEELKKSILQKAFSGELTANETVAV